MFTPSQHDVRRFFCETYGKDQNRQVLTPLESIALHWVQQHPEYAADLADPEAALAADYSGIRAAWQKLAQRLDSEHEAQHQIMECLGQMVWQSQRSGLPPDGAQYIACIQGKC
jgi:Domain of unknown function (DUF1841)